MIGINRTETKGQDLDPIVDDYMQRHNHHIRALIIYGSEKWILSEFVYQNTPVPETDLHLRFIAEEALDAGGLNLFRIVLLCPYPSLILNLSIYRYKVLQNLALVH